MKQRIQTLLAAGGLAVLLLLSGCMGKQDQGPGRYRVSFMGVFDTVVELVGYADSQKAFTEYYALAQERLTYYSQLFDRYRLYDGMNNLKTINDNAGIAPVEVEQELIDLLLLAREWEQKTDGTVNAAMGPVLEIWHDYRERYPAGTEGELPPMEALRAAAQHTDFTKVQIDDAANTVFLPEAGMSLDVGALAKGYATELVCQELYEQGLTSFILSSGGNVRMMDAPKDPNKTAWVIGIQDPQGALQAGEYVDSVIAANTSVVTSGDYQRYYLVNGKKMHHIIDQDTLMPADRYASVTVVTEHSGVADLLSTALFLLPKEEGERLVREQGAQAMWIYPDGTVEYTPGLEPMLKQAGGATAAPKQS